MELRDDLTIHSVRFCLLDCLTEAFEVSSVPVTLSALVFLPVTDSFSPYGVAGLGAYHNIFDTEGIAGETEIENTFNIGYHLGPEFKISFKDNVALNADYRFRFLNPNANEESLENTDFNGNGFRLGLVLYL
jgi:opacity protein-like surface antigen